MDKGDVLLIAFPACILFFGICLGLFFCIKYIRNRRTNNQNEV